MPLRARARVFYYCSLTQSRKRSALTLISRECIGPIRSETQLRDEVDTCANR